MSEKMAGKGARRLTPFGKAVSIKIIEMDISYGQLAVDVGISAPQLSNILSGRRPGNKHVCHIARRLGLDIKDYYAV